MKPTARFSWADTQAVITCTAAQIPLLKVPHPPTTTSYALWGRQNQSCLHSRTSLPSYAGLGLVLPQQLITSQSGIISHRSEPTTAWRPQADPRPGARPTCRNWADPGDPGPIALPPCIDNLREVGAGCCLGMRAIIIIGCKSHTPTYTTNPRGREVLPVESW